MPAETEKDMIPDSWYIIKKNAHAVNNPWLGRGMFGKLTDFLDAGGLTKFARSEAAFEHIQKTHPTDVGIMQVYEMKETPEGVTLTLVRG